MEWDMDWESMSEKPEIRYLGRAIDVRYPCNCIKCSKGKEALEKIGGKRSDKQLHIVIAPLDRDWKLQHVFIDMSSKSKFSRKGAWAYAIKMLGLSASNFNEFKKKLTKINLEFLKTTVGEYLKNYAKVSINGDNLFKNALESRVDVPVNVIPDEALELYEIDKKTVNEKIKIYKEAWKKILKGEDETEVYNELGIAKEENESEYSEVNETTDLDDIEMF